MTGFTTCMAAVAVADVATAKGFYGRLFGRDADLEPMPTLAQWDLAGGASVQVVEDGRRAGRSMATLVAGDFDATVAALRDRDLPLGDVIEGQLSRLVQVDDPDGNVLTIIEPPEHR